MINVLFLDLFGVLIGADSDSIIKYVVDVCQINTKSAKEVVFGEDCMRLERNEITFNQYFNNLSYKLNGNINLEEFKLHWERMQLGLLPMTKYLKKYHKHFKIYILTNTTNKHIQRISKKYIFINECDGVITSEMAKSNKPETEIFKFACLYANIKSENSAFIDDTAVNVEVAKKLGIKSHLYQNEEYLKQFLSSLL